MVDHAEVVENGFLRASVVCTMLHGRFNRGSVGSTIEEPEPPELQDGCNTRPYFGVPIHGPTQRPELRLHRRRQADRCR